MILSMFLFEHTVPDSMLINYADIRIIGTTVRTSIQKLPFFKKKSKTNIKAATVPISQHREIQVLNSAQTCVVCVPCVGSKCLKLTSIRLIN